MKTVDKILEKYPPDTHPKAWRAVQFVKRLDFSEQDVLKIGEGLFTKLPFANDYAYRVFAENLGVDNFLRLFEGNVPQDARGRDLVNYYLRYIVGDVYGVEVFRSKLEKIKRLMA